MHFETREHSWICLNMHRSFIVASDAKFKFKIFKGFFIRYKQVQFLFLQAFITKSLIGLTASLK